MSSPMASIDAVVNYHVASDLCFVTEFSGGAVFYTYQPNWSDID